MMWKSIKGYEGIYEINEHGQIKSVSRVRSNGKNGRGYKTKEKILKERLNRDGYYVVSLCKNSKSNNKRIHRLIAIAFIPNPYNKLEVNHKNGVRSDYSIDNLEWVTREENIQHSYDIGLRVSSNKAKHTRACKHYSHDKQRLSPKDRGD